MSEFNTSKNKLNKLWEEVVKNKSQIKNKDNTNDFFTNLLKQQNIKVPIEIYNSGDIILTSMGSPSTAIKGEKMPSTMDYSKNIDLEIPEDLLPFVKYSIEVNSIPDTEIHGLYEYDPSTWVGDNIRVKGDGILIYKGQPNVRSWIYTNFPTSWFLKNNISLTLSKKRWQMSFDLSEGAPSYVSRGGMVGAISSTEGTIEEGETIRFEILHSGINNHEIIELTTDFFRGKGRTVTTTYDGEGEIIDQVTVEDVTATRYFAQADSYVVTIISDSDYLGFETKYAYSQYIDSITLAEEWNRWLFWQSDNKRLLNWGLFGTIIGDKDGDFNEIDLALYSKPYNVVTLKRNTENYNTEPTIQYDSRGNPNEKSLMISNRNFKNYIKISESNKKIPKYRFKLDGNFIVGFPSTEQKIVTRTNLDIESQDFDKKNNIWYATIDENKSSYLSGQVQNIYHKKSRLSGSVITEFFTDPINNSNHGITALNSTSFTAVGDETVTITPIDGEPIVTKRNNIIATESFSDYDDYTVTYTLSILDTVDFPVYNDVYTRTEGEPGEFSYVITENHAMLSKEVWTPESQDIILNIKAYLINPLYWREQRKYNKNEF